MFTKLFNNDHTLTSRLVYCGIVYARGENANDKILAQYQAQRQRGTNGFGFVTIGDVANRQRFVDELPTIYALGKTTSKEIMFHHRYPTSTQNVEHCNHPIANSKDYNCNYYMVHNGVIGNAKELFATHTKKNLHYETSFKDTRAIDFEDFGYRRVFNVESGFNDSEALLHELAQVIEGRKKKVEAKGSIAFIMLATDKDDKPLKLYFGRGSNPLNMLRTPDLFMLSSEGEGEAIKANTLYSLDYATNTISESELALGEPRQSVLKFYDDLDEGQDDDESISFEVEDDEVINFLSRANSKYMAEDWNGLYQISKQLPSLVKKHSKTPSQKEQWRNAQEQVELLLEQLSQPN